MTNSWLAPHVSILPNGLSSRTRLWLFGASISARKHGRKSGSRKSVNTSPKRGRKIGSLRQVVGIKQKTIMRTVMRKLCQKHPNPHPHPHHLKRNLRFPKKGREFQTILNRIWMLPSLLAFVQSEPCRKLRSSRLTGNRQQARKPRRCHGRKPGKCGSERRSTDKAGREVPRRKESQHSGNIRTQ